MELIFQENVPSVYGSSFIASVKDYCRSLNIDPNWLMAVMYFETAGTFSASIRNPFSNATGLIQFMPNTALSLGTSIDELALMTAEEQLYYVYQYYYPYRNRMNSYVDLYLATFFPVAMGKASNYVLQTSNLSASTIADANPVFDLNNDRQITVGEITKLITNKIPQAWRNYFLGSSSGGIAKKKSWIPKVFGISLLGYIAYKIVAT
ncbi:hypothetical protein H2O64_04740 [Kordia sp. YSTF-M3]|uniref:Transglycosylase SLT domain-containing protein n=1 Tax=Kordia aestuariivivens TaxID=2759037 RepID=A0ABR7Q6J0_9FLAO|nr:hypothetical protein [Kordia aestuariivivens]MBC8753966.1 hypothetical protein [Kordia aestuariivivens]